MLVLAFFAAWMRAQPSGSCSSIAHDKTSHNKPVSAALANAGSTVLSFAKENLPNSLTSGMEHNPPPWMFRRHWCKCECDSEP